VSSPGSTLSPPSRRTRIGAADTPLSILFAAAFALGVLLVLPGTPKHVSTLSIVNPSPYAIRVEARAASGGGWVPVGTAEPNDTTVIGEPVDLGGTWLFRFSSGSVGGGQATATRADLTASAWTLTIPPEVINRLAKLGASVR
jgi:hypothetical protein